jgi:hypothetical protein
MSPSNGNEVHRYTDRYWYGYRTHAGFSGGRALSGFLCFLRITVLLLRRSLSLSTSDFLLLLHWQPAESFHHPRTLLIMVFVDDDDSFYAENGFIGYVPGTVDPGLGLLIATMIFAVLSTAVLPCLVTLGRRYEKRRIAKQELERVDDVNEVVSEKPPEKPEAPILNGDEVPVSQTETPTRGENAPDSYVRGNSNSRSRLASLLDQVRAQVVAYPRFLVLYYHL